MTVNTLSRGWLDYAWMVRVIGQLKDDSLCGPTGRAQRVPAKSKGKTKGGPFAWGYARGGCCCETPSQAGQRNHRLQFWQQQFLIYIYIIIWHKISTSTPALWAVQGILLNCGTQRGSRGHGAGPALDSKPTSHQNWWWKLHLSWQKAEPGQSWRLLEITSPFFCVWERYAGSNVDSSSITSHRCLWALGQAQGGWQRQMLLFYIRKVLHSDKLRLIQLHR